MALSVSLQSVTLEVKSTPSNELPLARVGTWPKASATLMAQVRQPYFGRRAIFREIGV
jgi:hypothetical protein